jgi:hypothetical protein
MSAVRIVQNRGRVLLLVDGRLVADMPWQAADNTAAAFRSVARKAEEWDSAERIIADQALLHRIGVPLGLTDHPLLQREAVKMAQSDRALRRYLPGGVRSKEVFGTPKLIQKPPQELR